MPSTRASLRSPSLVPDDRFAVFLDIFGHDRSASAPMTPIGSDYQGMFDELATSWQAGDVPDLGAGLRDLDDAIDERIRSTVIELGQAGRLSAQRGVRSGGNSVASSAAST